MDKPRGGGIYGRLFRSFLIISLVPLIFLGAFTLLYTRQLSLDSVGSELEASASAAAGIMEQELAKYAESLEVFSGYDEVASLFGGTAPDDDEIVQLNQKMYLLMAGRTSQLTMRVIASDGSIIHSTSDDTGIPDDVYSYWGLLRTLAGSEGVTFYPGTYGEAADGLTLACPIKRNGKTLGYSLLCIPGRALTAMLTGYEAGLPVSYILTDANNYLLADQITGSGSVFLPLEYRSLLKNMEGGRVTYEADGDQMMLVSRTLSGTGMRLLSAVSIGLVVNSNRALTGAVVLICLTALTVCLFVSRKTAERIVRPIRVICGTMEAVEGGDLNAVVPEEGGDEFTVMAHGFNHMLSELKEQFRANMERQNRLRLAEYKNLQAQISPHFLYNTLESIKYMARLGMNSEIDTVVSKLGIMLKSGMNFKQDMIPFRDELKVVESYIAIQMIRYEGKFTYTEEMEPGLTDCMVPNLVIQPLVENAVVHGIETKMGSGALSLRAWSEGGDMLVEIYDDGAGMDQAQIDNIFSGGETETPGQVSIGMVNVHRRLQLYFGGRYGLTVQSEPGRFTRVTLRMPKTEGGAPSVPGGDS